MQTSAKKACFQFAECSLSSAKIRKSMESAKYLNIYYGSMPVHVGKTVVPHSLVCPYGAMASALRCNDGAFAA